MKGKLAPLILMLILSVALIAAQPAQAQLYAGSAPLVSSDGKTNMRSTITCNGTGTDSSDIFYFKDLVPYGAFWIKYAHKDTLGDSIYYPKLYYKFVKGGKYFASDSIDSWITLLANDSTKIAITAGDTIYWRKTYDFRAGAPDGIIFKGTGCVAHDSATVTIEGTGAVPTKDKNILLY